MPGTAAPTNRSGRYPIRVVAERTGLTPAALRAWERRYAVVAPTRTTGSQRLYTDADIERLRLVMRLASEGYALSDLAQRPTSALVRMASAVLPASGEDRREHSDEPRTSARVERLMSATRHLNPTALRAELTQSVLELGPVTALDDVLSPFLTRLGEEWACGDASVAHEHMASAVVRDVLGWLLQSAVPGEGAPTLVAATVAGEAHEFGAMMAAIVAAVVGWRVLYLGPNTPAADLARFAREAKARVVVVAIAAERERGDVQRELAALRATLGARTKIVAGGMAAANHRLSLRRAKIEILESRQALRAVIDATWSRNA